MPMLETRHLISPDTPGIRLSVSVVLVERADFNVVRIFQFEVPTGFLPLKRPVAFRMLTALTGDGTSKQRYGRSIMNKLRMVNHKLNLELAYKQLHLQYLGVVKVILSWLSIYVDLALPHSLLFLVAIW